MCIYAQKSMHTVKGHSVSNQQGILGHFSDFDET